MVFSSNPSSPLLDLYEILDDKRLDRKQDEDFDDTMQQVMKNIENVSKKM